jgi:hypothetical protein
VHEAHGSFTRRADCNEHRYYLRLRGLMDLGSARDQESYGTVLPVTGSYFSIHRDTLIV